MISALGDLWGYIKQITLGMRLQRMSHKTLPFPLSLFKRTRKKETERNFSTLLTNLNANQEIFPFKLAFQLFSVLIFLVICLFKVKLSNVKFHRNKFM